MTSRLVLLGVVLWAAGCGSSTTLTPLPVGSALCPAGGFELKNGHTVEVVCDAQLTRTVPLPRGDAHCPAGGLEIQTGFDDGADGGVAGDGQLEPGEVTSTQYVCNAAALLTAEVAIPVGDPRCPLGGTELEVGFDDGSGGGIANDGILEPGEVRSTQVVCNSDPGVNVGSFQPPSGAPGPFTFNARGGAGTAGDGGNGGTFLALFNAGTLGGHVKLFQTGAADASFELSPLSNPDLGSNPLEATAGTTEVFVGASTATPGVDAGAFFTLTSSDVDPSLVYRWDGAASTPITGIRVASGATLSFDADVAHDAGIVGVRLNGSLFNAGTLTTQQLPNGAAAGLAFTNPGFTPALVEYVGAVGSSVVLAGAGDGGSGGTFVLFAQAISNQGTMDVSGAPGPQGGPGGQLVLQGQVNLQNTGALSANGGAGVGEAGNGGNGGTVSLGDITGALDNVGVLSSVGGAGELSGGDGGLVQLVGGFAPSVGAGLPPMGGGDIHNAGALLASGGDAAASCSAGLLCQGGAGGIVAITSVNGNVFHAAEADAFGGAGASGAGGGGGTVSVLLMGGENNVINSSIGSSGTIFVSGNLDVHGGAGANGGGGGALQWVQQPTFTDSNSQVQTTAAGGEIQLLGYGGGVDVGGGDGTWLAGAGGSVALRNNPSLSPAGGKAVGGSALNYCDVAANGGNGTAAGATGGAGGSVDVTSQLSDHFPEPIELAINAGNLTANGGSGMGGGAGTGGSLYVLGRCSAATSGAFTANGGGETSAAGGSGTYLQLSAVEGPALNSGVWTANGGASTQSAGGHGAQLYLSGDNAQNTNALSVLGGAGGPQGGAGGQVWISSLNDDSQSTGSVALSGGAGAAPGAAGAFFLDGLAQ
jgi:hypothetical protein